MSNEVLSLSTIVETATVNIVSKKNPKGKLYDLAGIDDLGVFEHQKIVTLHASATTLLRSTKPLTDPQSRALRKALGDIVSLLLPGIEPSVLGELTNAKRSQIITVWAARNEPTSDAEGNAPRRTTAGSSRRSKRSTAATRKRGSTTRRG